jgi:hypothetical protein
MELSRKKIILIPLSIWLLSAVWVWFFFFNDHKSIAPASEAPSEILIEETPDQIRVRQVNLIKKSLESALKRGLVLPEPKDAVYFNFWDIPLAIQGHFPDELYEKIGLNILHDPTTKADYFYALSPDGKSFEILAFLDEKSLSEYIFWESPVYRAGIREWLFLTDLDGNLLIHKELDEKLYDLSNMAVRQGMGFETLKSCRDIYDLKNALTKPKSWIYSIDIGGTETKVFCDMQTDGGGWTLFYANNGHPESPIQKSYVEMREALATTPLDDISAYDDPNLAGLLDFKHFTELGAKQVLIRNRAGDVKKWIRFTFSTSRALKWALGPAVLGKTDGGCYDLPRGATWDVESSDKMISFFNLTELMNHTGVSWWVAHDKYPCNLYDKKIIPHIAFYNAFDSSFGNRARSDLWTWGIWWGDNNYRYFIK